MAKHGQTMVVKFYKMNKTTFNISKMDCSSEEQLIRLKLQGVGSIKSLHFDIPNRKLEVFHSGDNDVIFQTIDSLKLDTKIIAKEALPDDFLISEERDEKNYFFGYLVLIFLFSLSNSLQACWPTQWVLLQIASICWPMHLFLVSVCL